MLTYKYDYDRGTLIATGTSDRDRVDLRYTDLIVYLLEGNDWVHGTNGKDTVYGGPGKEWIWGYGGDDILHGNQDDDVLQGHTGNDRLYGGKGDDTLEGGSGDDFIRGGPGDDWHEGGPGNDTIWGGKGNDIIRGWTGDDKLYGGSGDDYLIPSFGNDTLEGGHGSDLFEFGPSHGSNTITDFTGKDKILFETVYNALNDLTITQSGSDVVITYDDSGGSITLTGVDKSSLSSANFAVTGSYLDETFYASPRADIFLFTKQIGGSDRIEGFEEGDRIEFRRPVGGDGFDDLEIVQQGEDAVITYSGSGGSITLVDVDASSLSAEDFNFIM